MKYLLLCTALVCALTSQAQTNTEAPKPETNRIHELRLDAVSLIANGNFNASYEYVLSKFSGVGGGLSVDFDGTEFDLNETFSLFGFYRQYFFNKKDYGARGLFVEGSLRYASYKDNEVYYILPEPNTDVFVASNEEAVGSLGVAFAIGQKWVSANGFILELSGGIGRNFNQELQNGFYYIEEIYFRGGILIGYRF